jgi:hypothetical protein
VRHRHVRLHLPVVHLQLESATYHSKIVVRPLLFDQLLLPLSNDGTSVNMILCEVAFTDLSPPE